jgi:hypothetical protein
MKPIPVETALINLYNNTRKALLPLEEHDNNRVYLDILSQALGLKLQWSVPASADETKSEDGKAVVVPVKVESAPKQIDIINMDKSKSKKKQ